MFGARYFGPRYWGPRYYATIPGDGEPPVEPPVDPPPVGLAGDYSLFLNNVLREPQYGWEVSFVINGQSSFRFDILSEEENVTTTSIGRQYFSGNFFSPFYFAKNYFGGESSISEETVVLQRKYFSSYYFSERFFPSRFFGGVQVATPITAFYRPTRDEKVELYEADELLFGGMIIKPRETGLHGDRSTIIKTAINALDYKVLTQRRFVNETIPPGTLKQAMTALLPYLPGITIDISQVDGPEMPELVYDYTRFEEVMNIWAAMTGYAWDISPLGAWKFAVLGTEVAPYDITPTNDVVLDDIEVEVLNEQYANRIIAKSGTLVSIYNDEVEQEDHDVYEALISAPNETDQITLDALAADYGTRSVVVPRRIRFPSLKRGFKPRQIMHVNAPKRNLNAHFTITEVKIRRPAGRDAGQTFRDIIAVEGTTYRPDWRDIYKQWSGSAAIPVGGGSTGGAAAQRPVYPLAMNKAQAVRANTPTWIDAPSAIHVYIDPAARGTTLASIRAQMRVLDAGNSVQARLYDVSIDQPVAGSISPVVTSTEWSSLLSWNVVLNSTAHTYKLQLLIGLLDAGASATAYLE